MPSLVNAFGGVERTDVRERTMAVDTAHSPIIHLNVGGKRYTTSVETLTLCRDSMLGAMFHGGIGVRKDEDDCYFIDRDGKLFRHILNFLRTKTLHVSSIEVLQAIKEEAEYYCLQDLVDYVTAQLDRLQSPRKERRKRKGSGRGKVRTISLDSDFSSAHNHSVLSSLTSQTALREDSTFLEEEEQPYELVPEEQADIKIEFEQDLFIREPDF